MSYRDKQADELLSADTQLPCCLGKKCREYNAEASQPQLTPVSVVVALELYCKRCKRVFCIGCLQPHSCTSRKDGAYSFAQLQAAAARAAPAGGSGKLAKQQSQQQRPSNSSSNTQLDASPAAAQAAVAAACDAGRPQARQRRPNSSSSSREPFARSGRPQCALPAAAALAQSGTCKLYDVSGLQVVHGRAPKDTQKYHELTQAFYPRQSWMEWLFVMLAVEERRKEKRGVFLQRTRRQTAAAAKGKVVVTSLADAACAAGAALFWEKEPDPYTGAADDWVVWSGARRRRQGQEQGPRRRQQQRRRLGSKAGAAAAHLNDLFAAKYGSPPLADGPANTYQEPLQQPQQQPLQQQQQQPQQQQQAAPGRMSTRQGSRKQKGGGQKRQREQQQKHELQEHLQLQQQYASNSGQGTVPQMQLHAAKGQQQHQQAGAADTGGTLAQQQQPKQQQEQCHSSEPELQHWGAKRARRQAKPDQQHQQQGARGRPVHELQQHEQQRCSKDPEQAGQTAQQQRCSKDPEQAGQTAQQQRCSKDPEQAGQTAEQQQRQAEYEWGESRSPFAIHAACNSALLDGPTQAAAGRQYTDSMGAAQPGATAAAAAASNVHTAAAGVSGAEPTGLAAGSQSAPPDLLRAVASATATAQAAGATVAAAALRVVASADASGFAAAAAASTAAAPVRYPNTECMQHLYGCVPEMPPVAAGELRALGQTMHPAVAERYKQVLDDFWGKLAVQLSAVQSPAKPTRAAAKASRLASGSTHLQRLHVSLDPAWIPPTIQGSMAKWCKDVGIDGDRLLQALTGLINAGLAAEGSADTLGSAVRLPQALPCRFMEPYRVPEDHPVAMLRGQQSVRATEAVPKGTILSAYQGYMLFEQGFSELKLRAKPSHFTSGHRACDRACAPLLWEMQTESYAAQDDNMQVPCPSRPHQQQPGRTSSTATKQQAGGTSSVAATAVAAAAAGEQSHDMLWCSALGYGNKTALVNDPSLDPLAVCYDDAAYARRALVAQPNVVIRVLWVRNWPFLFMITDRDVQRGEDYWYDYTAPYWRIIHETLERIQQITGMSPSQAFEAAVKMGNGQGSQVARLFSDLQDDEAPTQTVSIPVSGASAALHYAEAAKGIPPQGSSAAAMAAAMATAGDGSAADAAAAAADKEQDSAPPAAAAAATAAPERGTAADMQLQLDGSCSDGADVSGPASTAVSKQEPMDEPPVAMATTAFGAESSNPKALQTGSRGESRRPKRTQGATRCRRPKRQVQADQAAAAEAAAAAGAKSAACPAGQSPAPKRGRFLTLPPAGVKSTPQQQQGIDGTGQDPSSTRHTVHGEAPAGGTARGVSRSTAQRRERRRRRSRSCSRSRERQPLQQQEQQQLLQAAGHAGSGNNAILAGRNSQAGTNVERRVPGPPGGSRTFVQDGPGPGGQAAPLSAGMPGVGRGGTGGSPLGGSRPSRPAAAAAAGQQASFEVISPLELQQQQDSMSAWFDDATTGRPTPDRSLGRVGALQQVQQASRLGPDRGPGSAMTRGYQPGQPGRPDRWRQGPESSLAAKPVVAGQSLWRTNQPRPDSSRASAPAAGAAAAAMPQGGVVDGAKAGRHAAAPAVQHGVAAPAAAAAAAGGISHLAGTVPVTSTAAAVAQAAAGVGAAAAAAAVHTPAMVFGLGTVSTLTGVVQAPSVAALPLPASNKVMVFSDDEADSSDSD